MKRWIWKTRRMLAGKEVGKMGRQAPGGSVEGA